MRSGRWRRTTPPPTAPRRPATASSSGSGSRTTRPAPSAPTSAPTPARCVDRLELTRATHLNLSPIFSLSTEDPWPLVEPALSAEPWGEVTDPDGTVNRVWRVADPAVVAAVVERLAGAQLLIADGHHRYETARAYRDEVGGEGPQNYTLMALTGLDDPGLTVFPTHRLLSGFAGDPARRERLARRPPRHSSRSPR